MIKAGEIGTQDCQCDVKMLGLEVGIQKSLFQEGELNKIYLCQFLK
jgi:hypothetical protein